MVKSILKEVCIMLLLCIAIILIFVVIFYESIPSNKTVPNKLSAYETPENIQEEIEEEVSEKDKVEVSYEITGSDLTLYKQTNGYVPGKPDPFADTSKDEQNGGTVEPGNNQGGGDTQNGETTTDPNSTGTFFENTGHK